MPLEIAGGRCDQIAVLVLEKEVLRKPATVCGRAVAGLQSLQESMGDKRVFLASTGVPGVMGNFIDRCDNAYDLLVVWGWGTLVHHGWKLSSSRWTCEDGAASLRLRGVEAGTIGWTAAVVPLAFLPSFSLRSMSMERRQRLLALYAVVCALALTFPGFEWFKEWTLETSTEFVLDGVVANSSFHA